MGAQTTGVWYYQNSSGDMPRSEAKIFCPEHSAIQNFGELEDFESERRQWLRPLSLKCEEGYDEEHQEVVPSVSYKRWEN